MKRWLAIGGGALGVALIGYALFAGESDEEVIRSQLVALEDAVRFDGQGNPVMRGAALNKQFSEIFEKDVRVGIPELTSMRQGRRGLVGVATKASAYLSDLDVDFESVEIDFEAGGATARVSTRADVTATRRGGRRERDVRDVKLRFVQTDGEWRIASLSVSPKNP